METISDTRPENSPDAKVLQIARIPESNDVIVSESRVPKERELNKKPMARDEAVKTVKRKSPPNSASTVETDQSEDLLIGGASIMTAPKIVLPSSQVSKLDFILPSDKGEKPSMKKRKSAAVELGSGSEADIKQQEITCIKRAKTGKQPAPASKKKSKDIGVKKRALGRPRKKSKANKVPVIVIDDSEQPNSTELNTSTQVVATHSGKKKLGRPRKRKTEAKKVIVTVTDDSEQPKSTEPNTSTQVVATHSGNIEDKELLKPKEKKTEETAEIIPTIVPDKVPVTVIDDSEQPNSTELNTSTQVVATHSERIEKKKLGRPRKRKTETKKVPVTVTDDSEQPKSTEPNTSTQVVATHSGNIEDKELLKLLRPKEKKPEETAEIIPTIVPDKVPVTVIDDFEPKSTEPITSLQDTQMAATHSENIEDKELRKPVMPKERKPEETAENFPTIVPDKVPVTVIDDFEQPKSTEPITSLQDTQMAATHSEDKELLKLLRPNGKKTEETAEILPTIVPDKVPVTVIDDSEQQISTELNTSLQDTQMAATHSERIEKKKLGRPRKRKKVPVTVTDDSEQPKSTELNTSTQVVATHSGNIEDKELLKLLRPKEKKPAEIIPTIVPDKVPVTVIDEPKPTELNTSTQVVATHSENIEFRKPVMPKERKPEETAENFPTIVPDKVPVTVIDEPKPTELNTSTQVVATHSENIENKEFRKPVMPKERKPEETAENFPTIIPDKVPVTVIDDSEQPKSTEPITSLQDTQMAATHSEKKKLGRPRKRKTETKKVPVTVTAEQPKSTEPITSLQDTQMAVTHSEKKKLGRPRKRKTETKKVPVTVTDDSEQPKSTEPITSTQVAATTHSEKIELRKLERPKEKNPEETAEMTTDDDSDDGSVSENSYSTPPSSVIKVRPKVNIPVVFISSRTRSRLSFSDHSTIEEERPPPQKKPRKQRKPKLTLKRRRPTVPKVSPELYEQESDVDTIPCEVAPLLKATNENMTTEVRAADNTQSVRKDVTIKPSCDGRYSPEIPLQNMTTESVVNEDMLIEPVVMDTSPHMEEPTEQNVSQYDEATSTLGDKHSEEPATKEIEIHHSQNLNEISPTPLPAVIIPDGPAIVPVHVPPTALNKDTSPPPPVNDKRDNIELKKPIVSDVPPTALTKDTFPPPSVDDKKDKLKKPIVSKDSEAPRTFTNRLSISENDFTRKSKTHDKFRVPTRKTKKQSSSVDVRKNATMSEATMTQAIKKLPKVFPNTTSFGYSLVANNSTMPPPPKRRKTVSSVNSSTVSAFQLSIVDDQVCTECICVQTLLPCQLIPN